MPNKIIATITTKLGKEALYYECTKGHILQNHPETEEEHLLENITQVLKYPDVIREGRFENTETYFKITDISGRPFEGMFVHTKDEKGKTIITTFFEGKDKVQQRVIWSNNTQ